MGRDRSNDGPGSRFWLESNPDVRLMKSMIDERVGNHVECRQRTSEHTIPARLIDVESYTERETTHVVPGLECESVGGRYITLSHCWGRVQRMHRGSSQKSHYDHNTVRVPFRNLPRTFKEAVELTYMFGERYIWIDLLCIVQGCLFHWTTEAGKMADICSQSLFTLSAASNSAKSELYSPRRADDAYATTVTLKNTATPCGTQKVHFCENLRRREREEPDLPVNERAWCLKKESCLSESTNLYRSSFTGHSSSYLPKKPPYVAHIWSMENLI